MSRAKDDGIIGVPNPTKARVLAKYRDTANRYSYVVEVRDEKKLGCFVSQRRERSEQQQHLRPVYGLSLQPGSSDSDVRFRAIAHGQIPSLLSASYTWIR